MRWFRFARQAATGILLGLILFGWTSARAASANLSHSYNASGAISTGSIVSLASQQSNTVELANSNNGSDLLGVVVDSNDSLLAIDASSTTVQVATTGQAQVLVSTLNGPISTGDKIAVSPLSGIGMKAGPGDYVIGLAQSGFSDHDSNAQSQTVTDTTGHAHKLSVGTLDLTIAIGFNPANNSSQNGLQKFVSSLTGRNVSTLRIVVSLMVTAVALAALVTLVYASIFGSIISIGRNPLAKLAVFRTLGTVLGMALLIAVLAAGVIFLLLH